MVWYGTRIVCCIFIVVTALPHQAWIAIGSLTVIGVCAIPVFGSNTRPGHDLFSSEKPEAIREAQEAQRKEYRRLILEQRNQLEQDRQALAKFQEEQRRKEQ